MQQNELGNEPTMRGATAIVAKANGLPVAYTDVATPIGSLTLFATETGLVAVALPNEPRTDAIKRVHRLVDTPPQVHDTAVLAMARHQIDAYFDGALTVFDLPLDMRGTAFQRAVWAEVSTVAFGDTCSYGEIARRIGRPAAVRAVGLANGANPLPIIIPCHRVIGASGVLVGYGGGLPIKRALLAHERGQPALL